MSATTAVKRIALYGGSFDPPHVAHVMTVAWLLSAAPVDEVWIVPVAKHFLAKVVSKFDDRVLMCRLAFGLFGDRVQVRMDEQELGGSGASIDLVGHLQKIPEPSFFARDRQRHFARTPTLEAVR